MEVRAIKTRIFKEEENLLPFILHYIKRIPEGSVLVITSKIVALTEGRTVILKSKEDKINLIKKESDFAMKGKHAWLSIKDGVVMATAGIDESNADGKAILLPRDSFRTAFTIRKLLKEKFKIKNFGVLITDSRTFPLRTGTTGVAVGYAGFKGIKDYRGDKDIFGRILKRSRVDMADSLATAAVLVMGEGNEIKPLAMITDAPVEFIEKVNKKELIVDPAEDTYQPLFEKIRKIKRKRS